MADPTNPPPKRSPPLSPLQHPFSPPPTPLSSPPTPLSSPPTPLSSPPPPPPLGSPPPSTLPSRPLSPTQTSSTSPSVPLQSSSISKPRANYRKLRPSALTLVPQAQTETSSEPPVVTPNEVISQEPSHSYSPTPLEADNEISEATVFKFPTEYQPGIASDTQSVLSPQQINESEARLLEAESEISEPAGFKFPTEDQPGTTSDPSSVLHSDEFDARPYEAGKNEILQGHSRGSLSSGEDFEVWEDHSSGADVPVKSDSQQSCSEHTYDIPPDAKLDAHSESLENVKPARSAQEFSSYNRRRRSYHDAIYETRPDANLSVKNKKLARSTQDLSVLVKNKKLARSTQDLSSDNKCRTKSHVSGIPRSRSDSDPPLPHHRIKREYSPKKLQQATTVQSPHNYFRPLSLVDDPEVFGSKSSLRHQPVLRYEPKLRQKGYWKFKVPPQMRRVLESYVRYSFAHFLYKIMAGQHNLDLMRRLYSDINYYGPVMPKFRRLQTFAMYVFGTGVVLVSLYFAVPTAMLIVGTYGNSDCSNNGTKLSLFVGGGALGILVLFKSLTACLTECKDRNVSKAHSSSLLTAFIFALEAVNMVLLIISVIMTIYVSGVLLSGRSSIICSQIIIQNCCPRYVFTITAVLNVLQYILYFMTIVFVCLIIFIRNRAKKVVTELDQRKYVDELSDRH